MRNATAALLALILSTLGLLTLADANTVTLAVVVVTTIALAVLALHAIARPSSARQRLTRAGRQIDPSALVEQSDPDAEGHARPRAPGLAA
ncbi:MAG TPA: hypothetical protein DEA69_11920 [Microbacterium sp.]|jgi:hypothetical protein|uniref:DUF6412 domain-containing protein n=1 Tax=Microbacterium TaxID=33882 RepID=UPI000C5C3307|nr:MULTISPECIES: DUF6412 domain-containing protein [Microbacterium]MBU19878.1 hypothetical protein [Microbacterium sp.]MCC4267939.1 DUF6412 domain-containing protein [Microbacterium schleiferi]HBS09490.1 hypothetical protein [Microbacterium sp.]|tara:strand:+ start:357 stop:629 length:273 start_codon:yes stop_codon:yes gene_type:complete